MTARLALASLLACTLAPGCDGGGAPADGGPDAGPTIAMHGAVADIIGGVPSETIDVCLYAFLSIPCAHTAADGTYELRGIPADRDVAIAMRDAAGVYQPTLFALHTPAADFAFSPRLVAASDAVSIGDPIGVTADPTRGVILFFAANASGTGLDGVTAALAPNDAQTLAYIMGTFVPTTHQSGTNLSGLGLFLNVPTGDHRVRFSYGGAPCGATPTTWQGATADEARVPVVAGMWSVVGVSGCAP